MKWILNVVAVFLILTGVVWTLQGINVLPGSFMTGQSEWAITGIVSIIIGVGLIVFANRRPAGAPPTAGS